MFSILISKLAISAAVMLAAPFDGKTVVVTHHAPSSQSVHPRYARDLLTPAFASNLENFMDDDRAVLWIHGHMHESFDYEIQGYPGGLQSVRVCSGCLEPGFPVGLDY